MKTKEFYQRWKQGMKEITPLQYARSKMIGHGGGTVGLILAAVVLFLRKSYFFIPFLLFMIYLQWIEFKKARMQYDNLAKFKPSDTTDIDKKLDCLGGD